MLSFELGLKKVSISLLTMFYENVTLSSTIIVRKALFGWTNGLTDPVECPHFREKRETKMDT